jgi:N-acetylglucosamine-6-phosphate deacetylase
VSREALRNARVLGPAGFLAGRAVVVEHGRIAAIVPETDATLRGMTQRDLGGLLLLPGFVDVQVNGGGGLLFNDAPTVEGIRQIGAAHRRFGTTSFLPTLISDDLEVVAAGMRAVGQAIAEKVEGVIGIHIEGPFISERRRGAHDSARLRTLEASDAGLLGSLRGGTTLLTLAPENATPALLEQLAAAGVVLAAGHTDATFADISLARQHGLRGFTHLFNAMSPLTARAPGVVGAALYDSDSWCGIIVDGQHVDPVALKIALRAKRHDRFMLVTDAMPCVGSNATSFVLQGRTVHVRDGACIDEDGTLAGTTLDMAQAVRNAVRLLGLDLAEAVRMASEYPAAFLGRAGEFGRIAAGLCANFVLADDELAVHGTWIDGEFAAAG